MYICMYVCMLVGLIKKNAIPTLYIHTVHKDELEWLLVETKLAHKCT